MELSTHTMSQIFQAGFASTIAPCSWLLWIGVLVHWTPYYLLTPISQTHNSSARWSYAVILWMGFIFGFSVLGCFGTGITSPLGQYHALLRVLAGVWMCMTAYGFYIEKLQRNHHLLILNAFITGSAIACSWIPCVNPILGNILQEASEKIFHLKGLIGLGIYTIGLGIPFLIWMGIFEIKTIQSRFLRTPHTPVLRSTICIAILFYGILVATGQLTVLSRWIPVSWVNIQ